MLKKLKNRIKFWAVSWVFKTYFGSFMYPFDKADDAFKRMNDHQKFRYLQEIDNWVNSSAYKLESQELLRKLYQDLALKPANDIMLSAYRLTIMVEKDQQKRFIKKSKEYREIGDII